MRWPGKSTLALALLYPVTAVRADSADGYDLWRRISIDVCQRLPTLEEVACIELNAGVVPLNPLPNPGGCSIDFDAVIDGCLGSEAFAEQIALSVNDFTLPSASPNLSANALLFDTVRVNETNQDFKYFYLDGWGDCISATHLSQASFNARLDKAYNPFWMSPTLLGADAGLYSDAGGTFAYVCKKTDNRGASCGSSPYTASIASLNPTECLTGPTLRCDRGIGRWPCGCGLNLRWCFLASGFYEDDGVTPAANKNKLGHERLVRDDRDETFQTVKEIVRGSSGLLGSDVPFTDIFTADYSIRTSKLQQYYESNQSNYQDFLESDACYRQLEGIDKSDPMMVCNTPALVGTIAYDDAPDWQRVDFADAGLAYRRAGILVHNQFLTRQPTEPNAGNRIYSFWTCEEVKWKDWVLSVPGPMKDGDHKMSLMFGEDNVFFSDLETTTAALEPITSTDPEIIANCQGCHLTVNSVSAFRNLWDKSGRYNPQIGPNAEAYGAFLGYSGQDMTGLGELLASSHAVHSCIVNRTAKQLTGEWLARDSRTLEQLAGGFAAENFDVQALYRSVIATDEYRRPR